MRDLNTRPSGCKPDALTAELTAPAFSILSVTSSDAKRKAEKCLESRRRFPITFYIPASIETQAEVFFAAHIPIASHFAEPGIADYFEPALLRNASFARLIADMAVGHPE